MISNAAALFAWLDDVEDAERVRWGGGGIRLGDGVGTGDVEVFEAEEDGRCGGAEGLEPPKEPKRRRGGSGGWAGVIIVDFPWLPGEDYGEKMRWKCSMAGMPLHMTRRQLLAQAKALSFT